MTKNKRPSFLRRYLTYFIVGVGTEATRLLAFSLFRSSMVFEIANLFSILTNLPISFALHGSITWKDREGSLGKKFLRYTSSKGFVYVIKAVLPLIWLQFDFLTCPFYDIVHSVVDINLFTCDWMALATMDLFVALVITFPLHNWWSFKKKQQKETSS